MVISAMRPRMMEVTPTITNAVAAIPIRIDADWDDRLGRIVLTLIYKHSITANVTGICSARKA